MLDIREEEPKHSQKISFPEFSNVGCFCNAFLRVLEICSGRCLEGLLNILTWRPCLIMFSLVTCKKKAIDYYCCFIPEFYEKKTSSIVESRSWLISFPRFTGFHYVGHSGEGQISFLFLEKWNVLK